MVFYATKKEVVVSTTFRILYLIFFITLVFVLLFCFGRITNATIYQPGDTLEPDCAPGSINCGVAVFSLNSQTDATQTFATGTSGTDFNIASALDIHTFNIPNASAIARGLLTATDWLTFNSKQSALGFTPENVANKSTSISLGTSDTLFPSQNAVKTYVDNKELGLVWHNPVEIINVIADTDTPVALPADNDVYIINTGGDVGDWAAFDPGDLIQYQTNQWVLIKSLVVGDRFGVSFVSDTAASGSLSSKDDNLVEITSGTPGAFIYTFETPNNNDAVFVQNTNAFYYNVSFTYSTHIGGWVQLSASVDHSFGSGLTMAGALVSLGALTSDWNQTGAFDIITAGGIDIGGMITAGSSNVDVTLATGFIDADALTLTAAVDGGTGTSSGSGLIARSDGIGLLQGCTDGQILKWVESTDTWDCATDTGGTSKFVVKGTDENVPTGTTLQSDDALTFTVASSETWVFQFNLQVANASSAVPDWKAAILGASGWTCNYVMHGEGPGTSRILNVAGTDCDDSPTAVVDVGVASDAGVPYEVILQGSITTTSSGSVTLQWAPNTSGSLTVKAGSFVIAQKVGGSDLAEVYYTKDTTIRPGDVVSMDSSITAGVKKSTEAYEKEVFGIISTRPGLLLGDGKTNTTGFPVFVALSGRVPVKVVTENGVIEPGDYLTPSSTPGVAMKSNGAGPVIGQAMSAFNAEGIGIVVAFVKNFDLGSLGEASVLMGDISPLVNTDGSDNGLSTLVADIQSENARNPVAIFSQKITDGTQFLTDFVSARITAIRGYFDEIFTKKVHTEQLCVKKSNGSEVCVSGDELNSLLPDVVDTDEGSADIAPTEEVTTDGGTPPEAVETPPAEEEIEAPIEEEVPSSEEEIETPTEEVTTDGGTSSEAVETPPVEEVPIGENEEETPVN